MLRLYLSVRRKTNPLVPICLFCLTELRRLQASGGSGIPWTSPPPDGSLLQATLAGLLAPLGGTLPPHPGEATLRIVGTPLGCLSCVQPNGWCVLLPQPPITHQSAQCSTKNTPSRWTRYTWGRFSRGYPPPYNRLNCRSPEHAGQCEQIPPRLVLIVEALYSQPPLFSNLAGAVSTFVLTTRPNQCVPGQVQDSGRAPVSVIVLTPPLNRDGFSKHLHIRFFWSPAPAQVVPCSPMLVVTSVNQVAAYQVCSHPASVCPIDHAFHGICPNVRTLGSQRRTVGS